MFRKLLPKRFRKDYPLVAVVRLSGAIGMVTPMSSSLSLANCAGPIERAFSLSGVKAVALSINSPGGSPVQSRLIFQRIRDLSQEKSVPVFAFAEDVAASGGYMLACAGDEIYADPSSIIGSIGVVSSGFGFTDAIAKLGIERRVHTAGGRKSILDPFLPERDDDITHLKSIQTEIHTTFKGLVRGRRGEKLQGEEDMLFSGEFWAAGTAHEHGLIDGIGDMRTVMREKFGEKVRLKVVAPQRGWLKRRFGLSLEGLPVPGMGGASLAEGLVASLEERALWSRFGL
jgi:signal peptide peptidase SppA